MRCILGLSDGRLGSRPLQVAVCKQKHYVCLCVGKYLLVEEHKLNMPEAFKEESAYRSRVVHRQQFGRQHKP